MNESNLIREMTRDAGRMSPLHGGVGLTVRACVCRDEGCCVERLSSPKFSSGNKREKREEKRNRERRERERERERERVLWEGEGVSGWKKPWTDDACNEGREACQIANGTGVE